MEVTVAKTKALVNATAMETQQECMAIQASAAVVSNTEELIQARIKLGLSQNIAYVTANTTELASTIGVTPNMPQTVPRRTRLRPRPPVRAARRRCR